MAKTSSKEKTARLEEAKERFKVALEAAEDNRKAWLEDVKFVDQQDQWAPEIKARRSVPGKERPCLVVDKLGQYVRQVVNDGRQNRPAVKVRPIDGEGDPEVAEAFQGIIRAICDRRADQAFDTALEHAVKGGFGFFRLATEYAHENTFNQEIRVKRIRNPLCVLLDPHYQEADASDAAYGFVLEDVPKDDFKKRWPKAEHTDWKLDETRYGDGWLTDTTVRVCEYFYKVDEPQSLHMLEDGTTTPDEDYQRAIAEGVEGIPAILETREIPACKVKWLRMTGAEVLEENDWLGKYIPIIPVFGNETDIEGKVTYSGLIRKAKDAQRLYNFSRSAFAERVALTPKAPWLAADEAVEGKDEWADGNTGNYSVLRFRARDDAGEALPVPQRINPTDVPGGLLEDMQLAEHDIQGSLGMYNASLGEKSNEKSGKAIMARQREGDTGTFHYQDNQARAIGYLGVQLVDLIPKVYDSRRAARILGEDGKAQTATIDPESPEPVSKGMNGTKVFNLNAGKYDVSVAAGPSYTTKRQESVEAMMQLTQSAPQFLQVAGDIMVRNMDWPGAEEIADRLKKMLPPELQDENEDESPEVQAIKAQAQKMIDELSMRLQEVEGIAKEVSEENKELKSKAEVDAAKVNVEAYKAETERLQVVSPMALPELIQAVAQQTVQAMMGQQQPKEPPEEPDAMAAMPMGPPPTMPPDMGQMMLDPNQPPEGGFFTPEEGM